MVSPVTDPAILAQLEGGGEVTDPTILAQLEGTPPAAVTKKEPSFWSGVKTGFADPLYGAAQLADKAINPLRQMISPGASSMEDVIKERESGDVGSTVGRIVGNVVNPATWVGGTVTKLPKAAMAANAALQSAIAPTSVEEGQDFATEKAKQIGLGVGGAQLLGRAVKGFTPTKEAQQLMDQGIQPSFGQSVGGAMNRLESRITSMPLIGDAALMARTRPLKEFDEVIIKRVTGGNAKTLDDANTYASKLYDEVVPALKPTTEAVTGVQSALRNAQSNPEMTQQNIGILSGLIDKHFDTFGQLSGEGIKKVDSELGHLARKYAGGDPASKTLADEIYNVQQALRQGLEVGLPPELQGKMATANATWRELIPVNKAASSRADEKITPRALQKAIARQKRTDVTRMMDDPLIDPAVAVLPQNIPDSGTAGRLAMMGGSLGGASAFGVAPSLLGGGVAAYLGALRGPQAALVGNTRLQRMLAPYSEDIGRGTAAALRGSRLTEE